MAVEVDSTVLYCLRKHMPHRTVLIALPLWLLVGLAVVAKEPPAQEIIWPASGTPVVRFSFGKFKEVSSSGKRHTYTVDTIATNVWNKRISRADFSFYLFDRDKARIGEGYISVTNVAQGDVVKFQTS